VTPPRWCFSAYSEARTEATMSSCHMPRRAKICPGICRAWGEESAMAAYFSKLLSACLSTLADNVLTSDGERPGLPYRYSYVTFSEGTRKASFIATRERLTAPIITSSVLNLRTAGMTPAVNRGSPFRGHLKYPSSRRYAYPTWTRSVALLFVRE
jgi:hypothetical protein